MSKQRILVAALAIACALGVTTAVQASIPDGAGVIHGCYAKATQAGSPLGNFRTLAMVAIVKVVMTRDARIKIVVRNFIFKISRLRICFNESP